MDVLVLSHFGIAVFTLVNVTKRALHLSKVRDVGSHGAVCFYVGALLPVSLMKGVDFDLCFYYSISLEI